MELAPAATLALELFEKHKLNNILIPGFGFGRNAKIFADRGLKVTGIEISETAIDLAKKHFGESIKVYYGSVDSMPFDEELYDGISSYALIHLLSLEERTSFIRNCAIIFEVTDIWFLYQFQKMIPDMGKEKKFVRTLVIKSYKSFGI